MKEPLLVEFYKEIKDEYPQFTFEQIKDMVTIPFKLFREVLDEGSLLSIKFKRIGTFRVTPTRVKKLKRNVLNDVYVDYIGMDNKEKLLNKINEYENEIQSRKSI